MPAEDVGRRDTFDAHKERSTRRVRQRLEAARRVIDTEYFLEIDCRMLADTAQMSRHHFIRMFQQQAEEKRLVAVVQRS